MTKIKKDEDKQSLIIHPGSGLAHAGPQGRRIVAEMMNEALTLSREAKNDKTPSMEQLTGLAAAHLAKQAAAKAASLTPAQPAVLVPRYRIGEHEFCEPDYRQILEWASAMKMEPGVVVWRLLERPLWASDGLVISIDIFTEVRDGRLVKIRWDFDSLPLTEFRINHELCVEELQLYNQHADDWNLGFALPRLRILICSECSIAKLDLSGVPQLTTLNCDGNQLAELDLSNVPQLAKLFCHGNRLTELDLSGVPQLTTLCCWRNQFTELDLSGVPLLVELHCGNNQLTGLDLSGVPQLTGLQCEKNQLTELDLSRLPLLTYLRCSGNQLTKLDICLLRNLIELYYYDDHKTRLIQRPDQHF